MRLTDDWRVDQDLPCVSCGYNLRTLDMRAACPECGTRVFRSASRFESGW